MSDRLVLDEKVRCLGFIETAIGCAVGEGAWYEAIGLEHDGLLVAAVLYTNLSERNIVMRIAANPGRRWLNRAFLRAAFRYPFVQLKLARVTAYVDASNHDALRFDRHLGFVDEGCLRGAADDGSDVLVLGMLLSECRHLEAPILALAS